ncbi:MULTISPECIES: chemotaxis protein CheD [unclassified Motilimonas]|uniref:chemotaxis protein CheD n=1 Tax=Motilimonas TaxID=1914248 RepID=UPI001E3E8DE3|nr:MULTISPECIES: chemotaxis protein CheD [unclassified Motilimonas]MCE0558846.1 chemotaxis protein CheD [Motilimonas sp. E26]MDO6526841.1 chemotaxis protein CheD [Motilimonas sp. 1_MG-2023]
MKRYKIQGGERVVIDPGEFYVSANRDVISTLLGSCVAACLWDPINRVFGMNHFLLASRQSGSHQPIMESQAGRYGVHAMELLINGMLHKGAQRSLLQAKVFGGGNVINLGCSGHSFFAVGSANSQFIMDFLANEGIPLQAHHLGGDHGRMIHFVGDDYSVFMKRIATSVEQQVAAEERRYFNKELSQLKSGHAIQHVKFW